MPTNTVLTDWGPAHLRPEYDSEFEFDGKPEDN